MASIPVKIILDVDGDKPIEAKIKGQALSGLEGEGVIGYAAGEINWVDASGVVKSPTMVSRTRSTDQVFVQWLNSYPPAGTDTGSIFGTPLPTSYTDIGPTVINITDAVELWPKPGSSRIHSIVYLNVTAPCDVTMAFYQQIPPEVSFSLVSAGTLPEYNPTEYTQTFPVGKHRMVFSRQFDNLVEGHQIRIYMKASVAAVANYHVTELYTSEVGYQTQRSYANHDV